jgi:hypothetical protein
MCALYIVTCDFEIPNRDKNVTSAGKITYCDDGNR